MNKTRTTRQPLPEFQTRNGRRVVVLDEGEYERLKQKADEWEPLLPEPNASGNYPAVEYARASLARKIIRHRRQLGLTQADLARLAGIRLETLYRIELGKDSPTAKAIEKIERALSDVEADTVNAPRKATRS